jgi:hypothetical protein
MPILCPNCRWPAELDERGPAEDPAILLTGTAYLGSTPLQIVAIRIDPTSGRVPDYKPDVPAAAYAGSQVDVALSVLLDEFEYVVNELGDVLGEGQPSTVALPSGAYRLCALPASFKA